MNDPDDVYTMPSAGGVRRAGGRRDREDNPGAAVVRLFF